MFTEKFVEIIQIRGITPYKIAKDLNISQGLMGEYKKGVKLPTAINLVKIANYLDCSIDYLLTGEKLYKDELSKDEKKLIDEFNKLTEIKKSRLVQFLYSLQDSNNDIYEELEEQENNKIKYKSYIDKERFIETVSAGTGMFLNGAESVKIQIEKNDLTLRTDYILKISGDSMEPTFHDEDLIMVKYMPFLEIGEIGIFLINNKAYVKKFGGDRLISLNKDYEDILLNEYDDIRCQGKVIGVLDKNWIKK